MGNSVMESETMRPFTEELESGSEFSDPQLLYTSAFSRLYRVSRGGKYFIIKTPNGDSGLALSLIKREYEVAVGLSHPHLVNVLMYEPSTQVGPGIIMEYLDGRDLRAFLRENPSLKERKRIFLQLLDVVGYIHRCGIIHNDLKPENIIITRRGNDLKLIDFGLSDDDSHYLMNGMGGTRAYASPELQENKKSIDVRSDVFSIGKLMRELFDVRYARISRKCCALLPDNRYRNTDELAAAFRRAAYLKYVPAAVSALVLFLLFFYIIAFYSRKRDMLLLENRIGQTDSINAVLENRIAAYAASRDSMSEALYVAKQRELLADSIRGEIERLYAKYEKLLQNSADRSLDSLKKTPYSEFAVLIIRNYMGKVASLSASLSKECPDPDIQNKIMYRFVIKNNSLLEMLQNHVGDRPSVFERKDMPAAEMEYYNHLISNDLPYKPYPIK